MYESDNEDIQALKRFLMDIDCLDSLSEWTSKFNLFDVLKITRTEIRHSNMLAWLLNPNENHGLGDSVLRGFVQHVISEYSNDADVFETLLMDCYSFSILREWHNIDILAISEKSKCLVCIENKIDSKEHDNQLERYKSIIYEHYVTFRKIFIYLSPEGDESSDPNIWNSLSYSDVLNIIEKARQRVPISQEVGLLIDDYVATIRRDIVGDVELKRICAEIYAKHQKALDLIFENKPDRASMIADIIHAWAAMMMEQGKLEYIPEKSGKIITRFKTKEMSELLPDSAVSKSSWGTSNYYFYEIKCIDGDELFMQFCVNSKDITDDLRTTCNRINALFPSKMKKENWLWRTHFQTKHTRIKADEELSEEKIFEQLTKQFEEIKHFETKLLSLMNK